MRKSTIRQQEGTAFRIAVLDDEEGILESVAIVLKRLGYVPKGFTDQRACIDSLAREPYDLLILDYMMEGMHGNEVVSEIRKFNREVYILLLTGHKDIAPPIETLKALDIQGYCEKSHNFDQLTLLIESALKSIAQYKMIKRYQEGLNRILAVVPKIYQLKPLDTILEEILQGVVPIAESRDAFILIDRVPASGAEDNSSIYRGIGTYNVDMSGFAELMNPQMMERIGRVRAGNAVGVENTECLFPLIDEEGHKLGVMCVEQPKSIEGRKLCEMYAMQAASSISNAFLHSLVHIKHEELNKAYVMLKNRYVEIVEALRLAVDAKRAESMGHSDRVARIAAILGLHLSLGPLALEQLRRGAMLHDIGKIGIEDSLLQQGESLKGQELEIYYSHAEIGANILSAVSQFADIVPLVRHHHERFDGNGFPSQLKGDGIPLLSRIIHLANALDHWLMDTASETPHAPEALIAYLKSESGRRFDPDLVEQMITIVEKDWNGLSLM